MSIAYALFGSGPVIVFPSNIFGNLKTYREGVLGLRETIEGFTARGWSIVTYDGRGSGASQRDVGDFTLEASLRDFDAVVEQVICNAMKGLGLRYPPVTDKKRAEN